MRCSCCRRPRSGRPRRARPELHSSLATQRARHPCYNTLYFSALPASLLLHSRSLQEGFNPAFCWAFTQLAVLHYDWPFDSSHPALANATNANATALALGLEQLITGDVVRQAVDVPCLPPEQPPGVEPGTGEREGEGWGREGGREGRLPAGARFARTVASGAPLTALCSNAI